MNGQSQIRRNDAWLSAWIGDELMMMSSASGQYLSLTQTGGRIWDLLEETTTVPALCHALEVKYEMAPEQIRRAVFSFLEEMIEEDAVLIDHATAC